MSEERNNHKTVEQLTGGDHITDGLGGVHKVAHVLPYRQRYAVRRALVDALRKLADDIEQQELPVPTYRAEFAILPGSRANVDRWAAHLGAEVRIHPEGFPTVKRRSEVLEVSVIGDAPAESDAVALDVAAGAATAEAVQAEVNAAAPAAPDVMEPGPVPDLSHEGVDRILAALTEAGLRVYYNETDGDTFLDVWLTDFDATDATILSWRGNGEGWQLRRWEKFGGDTNAQTPDRKWPVAAGSPAEVARDVASVLSATEQAGA